MKKNVKSAIFIRFFLRVNRCECEEKVLLFVFVETICSLLDYVRYVFFKFEYKFVTFCYLIVCDNEHTMSITLPLLSFEIQEQQFIKCFCPSILSFY